MIDLHVYCDFDGTVATTDVTDSLLAAFGRRGWRAIEEDWRAGRVNARDCMTRQVGPLDMDPVEFHAHLDGIELDPGFPRFVADCEDQGIGLTILSDGLAPAIVAILRRHGLGHLAVRANGLSYLGERRWSFVAAERRPGCGQGTCKCAAIERLDALRRPFSILVGDGRSNYCGVRAADLVFAKSILLAYCRGESIPHVPMIDFDGVRASLHQLAATRLAGGPIALPVPPPIRRQA